MAPNRQKTLIVLTTIVASAVVLVSLKYFGKYQPYADLLQSGMNGPASRVGISMEDATVEGRTSRGKRLWRVSAHSIEISHDRHTVNAEQLHNGALYAKSGKTAITFRAQFARYTNPSDDPNSTFGAQLNVDGGIRAEALEFGKPVFTTPTLTWDPTRNMLQFPAPASVAFPKEAAIIHAETLVYDINTGTLNANSISGQFKVDSTFL